MTQEQIRQVYSIVNKIEDFGFLKKLLLEEKLERITLEFKQHDDLHIGSDFDFDGFRSIMIYFIDNEIVKSKEEVFTVLKENKPLVAEEE